MTVDVVVVGGGVSGLATAHDLKRRGCQVVVLERQAHPGGNAISERLDGFLVEHGPSTVNAASPAALDYSRELGLDGDQCDLGAGVRRRYLVEDGSLRAISIHPLGFLLSNYLSVAGRIRLMAEIAAPRRNGEGEETVEAFCSRRFGSEFARRVMDPLVGGLFAGRASELSVSAVFPTLVRMEQESRSISLGILRRRRSGGKMPGRRLFSWRDGVGSLPRALAAGLGASVRTGVAVRRIRQRPGGFRVDVGSQGAIDTKAVVLATQPHVAAQLLEGLDSDAAAAAGGIEAPPLAVVFLGYRAEQVAHPLDGLGYLAAQSESDGLSGAQFCSTMFPGRAPDGCVSIAGYIGGARAPERARLPQADLLAMARDEFGQLIGARGEPVVSRVRHWPLGLPQYGLGHGARIAELSGLSQHLPGFFLTGNYFSGPSVAVCLTVARDVANNVGQFLDLSGKRRFITRPEVEKYPINGPA